MENCTLSDEEYCGKQGNPQGCAAACGLHLFLKLVMLVLGLVLIESEPSSDFCFGVLTASKDACLWE